MSILSKVKSAAVKVKNAVVSGVKSFGNAIAANKGTSLAAPIAAVSPVASTKAPNQTIAPNISTPSGLGRADSGGSVTLLSSTGQPTSTIGPSTPYISGASPIYSAPKTLGTSSVSSADMTADVPSTISSSSFSSSGSEGGSMASSPSISLPSAPTYSNPGQINNGGLISSLADSYSYDAEKNMFVPITTTATPAAQTTETDRRAKLENLLQKMIPKKSNIYEDPIIKKQNEEIQQRKQEVNNYTSQLNSVVAQQNADLLRLRGVGSQEGVTETVYGGQAATINREAAIKALPIQAQLSAAQGNLQLAQDYLTQLTTWKKEEVDNDYNYKNSLYTSIKDFVKGEEKIRLDELTKQNDRAYEEKKANIASLDSWMKEAISKAPSMVSSFASIDPSSPNFRQQLASVAKRIPSTSGGGNGLVSPLAQAVISNPSLFYNFTPTQKGQIITELTSNGYDVSKLQNAQLSAGQQDDLAQMNTVSSLADQILAFNQDGQLEGIGYKLGSLKGVGAQLGFGSEESKSVRALVGNIQGTVAKLRGGTSFTPNEQKLLETYTPTINDSPAVAINKIENLKSFIATKNENLINAVNLNVTTGQITKPSDVKKVEDLRSKYNY